MTPAFGFSVGDFIGAIGMSKQSRTTRVTDSYQYRTLRKSLESFEGHGSWRFSRLSTCHPRAPRATKCPLAPGEPRAHREQHQPCQRHPRHGPCLSITNTRIFIKHREIRENNGAVCERLELITGNWP